MRTNMLSKRGTIPRCCAAAGAAVCVSAVIADAPPVVYGYHLSSSESDRVLMASVQGVVARTSPEIHLGQTFWLQELTRRFPGTSVVWSDDPAFFVDRYRSHLAGYILCDAASRNVATSVASATGAMIVDAVTLHYAEGAGLALVADVRARNVGWAFRTYGPAFNDDYLFHQAPAFSNQLRDFAIYKSGFVCYEDPGLPVYYAAQNPHTRVVGWAPSEQQFFQRASVHNLMGVAADWLENASVLCQWTLPLPAQGTHVSPCVTTEPDVHYVAFVMSDGDNVQWLNGGFLQSRWWGSPHRGAFTMNWDLTPTFAEVNPIGFAYYYETASRGANRDYFVTAGGPGIMYPSQYPDIAGFVAATGPAMSATDQSVISILEMTFDPQKLGGILADERILGMVLKIGDAYQGMGGQVHWFDDKPCVSVKYSLWDGFDTPVGLVSALNGAPRDPLHSQLSYSVVNVHPWSTGQAGDPMSNVRYVVEHLDPHVRVVTLEELFIHLRNRFGAPTCLCPANWNLDGVLDSQDFFDFLEGFFGGVADFNGIDGTESQDYLDFVEAFFGGC